MGFAKDATACARAATTVPVGFADVYGGIDYRASVRADRAGIADACIRTTLPARMYVESGYTRHRP
jgi:hypothetical protein